MKRSSKRGRPPGGRYSGGRPVLLKLSEEQRSILDRAAARMEMPLATWIRSLALREAKRELGEGG